MFFAKNVEAIFGPIKPTIFYEPWLFESTFYSPYNEL